jgi:hypothetical protein
LKFLKIYFLKKDEYHVEISKQKNVLITELEETDDENDDTSLNKNNLNKINLHSESFNSR